jgi:predicted ATPase with chaperone activity
LKSVWLFVHNVLLVGSPGAGKTLLAHAMPGILPEMSIEESLDVTRIYSVADQLPRQLSTDRRDESLPVWVLWRLAQALYLCAGSREKYQKRISGPLLDRIDIHIEVPHVDYE